MPGFVPKIFMFTGSSAVGKTTTLEALPKDKYDTVVLSARVPRAEMNNPAWADLMTDKELASRHQQIVFKHFVNELQFHINAFGARVLNGEADKHLVFDRGLWDVIGYTYAFECPSTLVSQMVDYTVSIFEAGLIDKGYVCRLINFRIDPNIPYVEIPARPPEVIRTKCAEALHMWLKIPLSTFVQLERDSNESVEQFVERLN